MADNSGNTWGGGGGKRHKMVNDEKPSYVPFVAMSHIVLYFKSNCWDANYTRGATLRAGGI